MPKNSSSFRSNQVVTLTNGTRLRAPFAGTATSWDNASQKDLRAWRIPAQEDTLPILRDALMESGVIEQETIHLDVDPTTFGGSTHLGLRGGRVSDTLILEPRQPQVPGVQVVLYVDEAGGMSWHLPDGLHSKWTVDEDDDGALRAPNQASFTIPTRTAAARRSMDAGQTEMRGWITAIGRKVLKVFILPVAAELLARPVEKLVGAVERKHGQNLIRPVTVDNFHQKVTTTFDDWPSLAGKRSLLIVHGIVSSTDGMLSKLPTSAIEGWIQEYEGRVIGYDHYTLSLDPDANAAFFLKQLKQALPRQSFDFDILCHSRGGIVSRALVERGRKLVTDHNCSFNKVFFVATPNAGSALGNPEHIVDMVDVFTNFLTKLPDGVATYLIEALLAIIKIAAYTAETTLPGLAAMGTQGYIRTVLNASSQSVPEVRYAAAAANYDPNPNSPNAFFAAALNAVVDRTFADGGKPVANDLVVPCEGVYAANGSPLFPIPDPLVYGLSDYVYHNDFFVQPRTVDRINDFLGITVSNYFIEVVPYPPGQLGAEDRSEAHGGPRPPDRVLTTVGGGGGCGGAADDDYEEEHLDADAEAAEPESADDFSEEFRGGYGGAVAGPGGQGGEPTARAPVSGNAQTEQRNVPGTSLETEAPTLPPTELTRNPRILFHERVTEGESLPLMVCLDEVLASEPRAEEQIRIALATGQDSVKVTVFLSAVGFDVAPAHTSLTVHRERDAASESATFILTAHATTQPIKRAIHADFFLDNSLIGSVTHYTYVVPKNYAGPESAGESRSDGFAVPTRPRQECDWTLAVVGSGPSYQVFLNSRIPNSSFDFKDMGKLQLQVGDFAQYLDSILTSQFAAYPTPGESSKPEFQNRVSNWKISFSATMEGLGAKLWQWLPEPLRKEYFYLYDIRTPPRSILIHSDEMIFPWELVIPNDSAKGTKLKPLGIQHVVGRWKPGLTAKPPQQMLQVRRLRVLNPNYAPPNTLKWAAEEATQLAKLFPGIALPVTRADLTGVLELFNESNVQVLHFSGHGEVNLANSDLNKILLENNQEFDALKLVATKLCLAQPVVYMNACSVGHVGETVGRAGGFASNFVTNGCSGVIAPLWPINDRRSMEFALALYNKLRLGRSIGEALQELREENEKDPTYSAYTYFGDPWVRLGFPISLNPVVPDSKATTAAVVPQ